jgi:glycosyltransferase involved in cell wall biosynthesis
MRIIGLLATYNEERFIASIIQHLFQQGVLVYLMDNSSTDRTLEIAKEYLGRGVVETEIVPRFGLFDLRAILKRKEELAASLDADWFMHFDADEIRLAPDTGKTLAQAFVEVDALGYNAVNFQEFTFVPTEESPDHDHKDFTTTMRWYYPFLPRFPHRLNAWKRQPGRVDLATGAGHRVRFAGLRMYPRSFLMRHYLFLSVPHAMEKYGSRRHAAADLAARWDGGWREQLDARRIKLPREAELRSYVSDELLDASQPRTKHFIALDHL